MRSIAFVPIVCSLQALSASAAVAKPVSFVCNFPKLQMSLTFVVSDPKDGKLTAATIVGNKGTDTVMALFGAAAVSFIEPLPTGAVQTTTVQLSTLEAIHSRHTLMGFDENAEFVPSQSKGTCELRD